MAALLEQNPGDGLAGLLLGNSLTVGCACPMSGWSFLQAQHTVSPQTSAERLEKGKRVFRLSLQTHLMGARGVERKEIKRRRSMGKNTREFNTTKVKGRDSKESHFFHLLD